MDGGKKAVEMQKNGSKGMRKTDKSAKWLH
jgi:hypothetical protein